MRLLRALIVAAVCLAPFSARAWWQSIQQVGVSGDAPQTTAFLARTSGLNGTETAAYKSLINGLVADGLFSKLDLLYIFATNTTTTANLNLISTSFGLTQTGTVSFTADQGYTGDGSTGFLNSNWVPSTNGVNFTQNSASGGAYTRTSRTATANTSLFGTGQDAGFTNDFWLQPLFTSNSARTLLNSATTQGGPFNANVQGNWVVTQNSSSAGVVYHTGSGGPSNLATSSTTTGVANQSMLIGATFSNTTVTGFSTDEISAAWFGSTMNATDAGNMQLRINTYMTALGKNVY